MNAEVIDKKKLNADVVSVGCKVKLYDEDFDEEVEYRITGSSESDPRNGIISNVSPVGAALLGHKVGDSIVVKTPGGDTTYKVVAISL